jgi:hypothetical protein
LIGDYKLYDTIIKWLSKSHETIRLRAQNSNQIGQKFLCQNVQKKLTLLKLLLFICVKKVVTILFLFREKNHVERCNEPSSCALNVVLGLTTAKSEAVVAFFVTVKTHNAGVIFWTHSDVH